MSSSGEWGWDRREEDGRAMWETLSFGSVCRETQEKRMGFLQPSHAFPDGVVPV